MGIVRHKMRFRSCPKMIHTFLTSVLLLFLQVPDAVSQSVETADSSTVYKRRKTILSIVAGGATAGSLLALNQLWYKDQGQTKFHFYNDNDQWLQMDKAGHAVASYYLASLGHSSLLWAGAKEKNALYLGGSLGLIYLTGVEILDGHSTTWGFSVGDEVANLAGSAFYIGQQELWSEQRISLKYSFRQSPYSSMRPDVLGSSLSEELLKDYNGQAYWLSFNTHSFLQEQSRFPKWLNFAVGYGADGMTYGSVSDQRQADNLPQFERERQLYFSLDIDLSKIETNSKALNTIFEVFGFLKIPAPAIEINQFSKPEFYWFR